MGANSNPSSAANNNNTNTNNNSNNPSNGGINGNPSNGLKHDPGISVDWSTDEQSILDEGLNTYASEPNLIRYAKIALKLQYKTVRDVALRCRWLSKKENGKRRKEEHNLARKSKDKKERVSDTKPASSVGARPNNPPYPLPVIPMDDDDISFKALGGPTGDLLENNAQVLSQISSNITNMQIQENISLFCKTRDNILAILKEMNDVPEIMKQMPPLPVKLNEDLANSILPRNNNTMQ